jgi:hypothetical protein
MGLRASAARLIAIVEGVQPITVAGDFGQQFTFHPDASSDALPQTRGFWFEFPDGARRGPYTTGRGRYYFTADLAIYYASHADRYEHQLVAAEDRVRISEALLNESSWDELATGLVSISAGEGDMQETLLPHVFEETDEGGLIQRLGMTLEVIEE